MQGVQGLWGYKEVQNDRTYQEQQGNWNTRCAEYKEYKGPTGASGITGDYGDKGPQAKDTKGSQDRLGLWDPLGTTGSQGSIVPEL